MFFFMKIYVYNNMCFNLGMNPIKVGNPKIDEPLDNIDNETIMLFQEFLFDPTVSIQQLVQNEQIEILDFVRFEMGETFENRQSLDSIETCG